MDAKLLTPGEVAELFRVDPKTVGRWAARGKLRYIRTPGGHRRFFEADVDQLLRVTGTAVPRTQAEAGWDAEDTNDL